MAIKNDANRRAVAKYKKENYDQILLRVAKGQKNVIQGYARKGGESVNSFIIRAIAEAMEREKRQKVWAKLCFESVVKQMAGGECAASGAAMKGDWGPPSRLMLGRWLVGCDYGGES